MREYEVNRNLTYPENLIDLLNRTRNEFQPEIQLPFTFEQNKGLEYVLRTLTDKEREIIKYLFEDNLSLNATGEKFGVTRERIRQRLKGVADRIHSVYLWDYLVNGYIDGVSKDTTIDAETGKKKLDVRQGIEVLGLSTRLENCLHRAGVETIQQFMEFREFYLLTGCGRKVMEEIINAQDNIRNNYVTPKFGFTERIKRSNLSQRDKDIILHTVMKKYNDSDIAKFEEIESVLSDSIAK